MQLKLKVTGAAKPSSLFPYKCKSFVCLALSRQAVPLGGWGKVCWGREASIGWRWQVSKCRQSMRPQFDGSANYYSIG